MKLSQADKKSLAVTALRSLQKSGIRYCLWKSIDRLHEGIIGKTDFDLLVSSADYERLASTLKNDDWFEVKAEAWRAYPGVSDFFKYDETQDCFLHFHIHQQLVMGDRRLKNLMLPLEELYLRKAIVSQGIPVVPPELEFVVFLQRLAVKVTSLDSFIVNLKRGERGVFREFQDEYEVLKRRVDCNALEALLLEPDLDFVDSSLVREAFENLHVLDFDSCKRMREPLSAFYRIRGLKRWFVAGQRLVQRRTSGVGRRLLSEGRSFAVVGADGSGKSTLAQSVIDTLKRNFDVRHVYLGGSPTSRGITRKLYRGLIFLPYSLLWRVMQLVGGKDSVASLKTKFYAFEDYLITREKSVRYRMAMSALQKGAIVLFERFPLFPVLGDGGPDLEAAYRAEEQGARLAEIQMPGRVFCLPVRSEDAIARRPEHLTEELVLKVSKFSDYFRDHREDARFVELDADLDISKKRSIILQQISKDLASDS